MRRDLGGIFKAYDVRGLYPSELDDDAARRIGWAFARHAGGARIVLGRDMRTSSPALASAVIEGVRAAQVGVVDAGLLSTDALYYASGVLEAPGIMITASHNPARYNGMKLCRSRAVPIGRDSGLGEIQALAESTDAAAAAGARDVVEQDLLAGYAAHCRTFVDAGKLRPLKVAIDAGNGMAGLTTPMVFDSLPFEIVPLFFELDGTFPNHPASPIEPENLVDLQKAVLAEGCDAGIAFDGDADRIFLVDERAQPITGSTTTALVADRMLARHPGATIIYNLICSWTVREVIEAAGGTPVRTRVGHSFIKQVMAETGAVFGGEHSGHYYFRDNFRADSGMIAALVVLEALSEAGVPLSELVKPYDRYFASGEINTEVRDQQAVIDRLAGIYRDGSQDLSDGLTVEYEDWWFNCRPSNTEPLLRLNLEAKTPEAMSARRDEVLAHIRSAG